MYNKFFFLFLIAFSLTSHQVLPQIFEVKGGLGIYNVYDSDMENNRPREINLSASPFIALLLDWEFAENVYFGWENRLRIKPMEIYYLGLDTTNNTLARRTKSDVFLINLDSKFISSFKLSVGEKISLIPYLGFGVSINVFENDPINSWNLLNENAILIYPDGEMAGEGPDFFRHSGFIGELGMKAQYLNFIFGFSSTIEIYETFIYNVGKPSYLFSTFFVGYRF